MKAEGGLRGLGGSEAHVCVHYRPASAGRQSGGVFPRRSEEKGRLTGGLRHRKSSATLSMRLFLTFSRFGLAF